MGWVERPGWMVDLSFSSTERPSDFLSPAGADVVSGFTGCGLMGMGSHGTASTQRLDTNQRSTVLAAVTVSQPSMGFSHLYCYALYMAKGRWGRTFSYSIREDVLGEVLG